MVNKKTVNIRIAGDSSLISDRWMYYEEDLPRRRRKSPWLDFCDSLYWLDPMPEFPIDSDVKEARFGFRAAAIKIGAIDAGFENGLILKKTMARCSFQIHGDLVEIMGRPQIREDKVRWGMGETDILYRAEFPTWSANLHIDFIPDRISVEEIVNLLNLAGKTCGIGIWRPARGGDHGMFHVEAAEE